LDVGVRLAQAAANIGWTLTGIGTRQGLISTDEDNDAWYGTPKDCEFPLAGSWTSSDWSHRVNDAANNARTNHWEIKQR
jgi:hypothetical protein